MHLVILALLAACTKAPPVDTSQDGLDDTAPDTSDSGIDGNGPGGGATVDNACTPDDGSALKFEFGLAHDECGSGASSSAYLSMTLYTLQPGPLPEGRRVAWSDEQGNGEATYKPSSTEGWVRGDAGWVEIDTWQPGSDVVGTYEVHLETADVLTDSFTIPFCDTAVVCG